ncbi:MAG: hypothetical protein V3W37_08750 [Candidatus Binatia bacterium]
MRKGTLTAEQIAKKAEELKKSSGSQLTLDNQAVDQYTQDRVVESYDPNRNGARGDFKPKPIGTGTVGMMVDRNVNVLRPKPFCRVIAFGGITAEEHASGKLEPWLNTIIWIAQGDFDVWNTGILDLDLIGEAWSKVLPAPQFWADDELTELVDKLNVLVAEGADEDAIKKAKETVRVYRRDNCAIVWRYVDPISVYPVWDERGIAEVYEIRKMEKGEIERLGGDIGEEKEAEVIEWSNHENVASVLTGKSGIVNMVTGKAREPSFLRDPWPHGLGTYPYVRIQRDPIRSNKSGHTRRGSFYHLRFMSESLDETITDWRTVMRKEVESPPIIKMNPGLRQRLGLEEKTVDVSPNEPLILYVDETGTEDAGRYPTATVNPQLGDYFSLVATYADRAGGWRPQVIGQGPSGESAVRFSEGRQAALGELGVAHGNLEAGFARVGELFLRSVLSLDQEVTVRGIDKKGKGREITVTPDDIREHERMTRGKVKLGLPVDKGGAVIRATALTDPQHPLVTDNYVREVELDIEAPQDMGDALAQQKMVNAMVDIGIEKKRQQALLVGSQLTPGDLEALANGLKDMPELAQMVAVGGLGEEDRSALLGQLSRSNANTMRKGVLPQESQLKGVQGG